MNVVGLSCPGHHGFGIVLLPNKTLLVTGLSTGLAREPRMRVPLLPQCFHNTHRAPALQVNWRLWTLNHNRHHADNSVHHPDVVSMTVMSATHIKIWEDESRKECIPLRVDDRYAPSSETGAKSKDSQILHHFCQLPILGYVTTLSSIMTSADD